MIVCLVYLNDCLLFALESQCIDEDVLTDLKQVELDFNIKDDVAGLLGILIVKNENCMIGLKQTGLMDWIIKALSLEGA